VIYCEDSYGGDFFRRLVARLIKESVIENIKIETQKIPGPCWTKTERQIKASLAFYDAILLIVDAEGGDRKTVRQRLMKHVPKGQKTKVRPIIFDFMIEEWICLGLGIKHGSRPSEDLSAWKRENEGATQKYQKRQLPGFAEKIDLSKLENDKNFKTLLKALND